MAVDIHEATSRVGAAIGNKTRARILYALMDGRARTSTELAVLAEVSPSTASEHLVRLCEEKLLHLHRQGRHRYYALRNAAVATLLEQLSALATDAVVHLPRTPRRLRLARTCYDHLAGSLAVAVHDFLLAAEWMIEQQEGYELTARGADGLKALGLDCEPLRVVRRRFAYPCLDWSERKPHLAGSLGAALLDMFVRKRWIIQDLDSRAVSITNAGCIQFVDGWGLCF